MSYDTWIQFNLVGSFIHIFFPSRIFYKTLGLLNLEYLIFTQFTGSTSNWYIMIKGINTIYSSGHYIILTIERWSKKKIFIWQSFFLYIWIPLDLEIINWKNLLGLPISIGCLFCLCISQKDKRFLRVVF